MDLELEVVHIICAVDGKILILIFTVQRLQVLRFFQRVITFLLVRINCPGADSEIQIIVRNCQTVFRYDLRHIGPRREALEVDRLRTAVHQNRLCKYTGPACIINIKVKIAVFRIECQGNTVRCRPVLIQREGECIHIPRFRDRSSDVAFRRHTAEVMDPAFCFVRVFQRGQYRQFCGQGIAVGIAAVAIDFQIVIPGCKSLQGKEFIIGHAVGVIDPVPLGIVKIHFQVARPLLEGDTDIAGGGPGTDQREFIPVCIIFIVDGQTGERLSSGPADHGCGFHGIVIIAVIRKGHIAPVVPADTQFQIVFFVQIDAVIVSAEVFCIAVDRTGCQFDPVTAVKRDHAVKVAFHRIFVQPLVCINIPEAFAVALTDISRLAAQRISAQRLIGIDRHRQVCIVHTVQVDHGGVNGRTVRKVKVDFFPGGIDISVNGIAFGTGHCPADRETAIKCDHPADSSPLGKGHIAVGPAVDRGGAGHRDRIKRAIVECCVRKGTFTDNGVPGHRGSAGNKSGVIDGTVDKGPVPVEGIVHRDSGSLEGAGGVIVPDRHITGYIHIFSMHVQQFIVLHKEGPVLVHPGDQRIVAGGIIKAQFPVS